MDPGAAVAIVLAAVVAGALLWRPARGRRRSVEETLAADELARERDRRLTDATEAANRYNLRPPGR